jgi:hypothetical protein
MAELPTVRIIYASGLVCPEAFFFGGNVAPSVSHAVLFAAARLVH